jgi:lysozyme
MMGNKQRVAVAVLALTAAAFVERMVSEGWTEAAIIPTRGDVPTVGPGLTKRPDGSPVQMGDRVTPLEGIQRSFAHAVRDEAQLKRCITAPLSQGEYEALADHAYQYGPARTCSSSMVRLTNQQRYEQACEAHLAWRKINGGAYDCSTLVNGKRNTVCWGVWERAQKRHAKCMGA